MFSFLVGLLGCGEPDLPLEVCGDGLDNDRDGRMDCFDRECSEHASCQEVCNDGIDNDLDGEVDCEEPDCFEHPHCIEDCDDGVDNDLDGKIDCWDFDCEASCPEMCFDGIDNDADGDVDCQDSECIARGFCPESCNDGVDNDGDGLIECEAAECESFCFEVDCADGLDGDRDGFIDCEDEDCWGMGPCPGVVAIRALSGVAESLFWSRWTSAGGLSFTHEVHGLRVNGLVQRGASGSLTSCSWFAEGVSVTVRHGSDGDGFFEQSSVEVSGLEPEAGCAVDLAPYFSHARYANASGSSGQFDLDLDTFPRWDTVYFSGRPWLHGSVDISGTHSYFSPSGLSGSLRHSAVVFLEPGAPWRQPLLKP
jgi:hypothetical protein